MARKVSPADALLAQLGKGKRRQKPKGLPKRTGRRAAKYARYYASTMPGRKLRHLLRRNGGDAARAWAQAHAADGVLNAMLR